MRRLAQFALCILHSSICISPVFCGEPTLARWAFVVPPERMAEFEAAYREKLLPILRDAGLVPSSLFSGVTARTTGTPAAGASFGLLMQGSSVGQLLVPPLVVAAGTASSSWAAQPAVLSCLGLLAVLGGVLYRRWDVPHPPVEATG